MKVSCCPPSFARRLRWNDGYLLIGLLPRGRSPLLVRKTSKASRITVYGLAVERV